VEGADSVEGPDEVGRVDDLEEEVFGVDVVRVNGLGLNSRMYDDRPHLKEE